MYIGEYSCKMDEKNRFIIPSKFRIESSQLLLTFIDEDTIIVVNSIREYDKIFSKLEESIKNIMMKYIRINSISVSLDSKGRVTVPACRINFKEAMVIGVAGECNYFIIHNKEKYLLEKEKIKEEARVFLESEEGREFTLGLVFGK